MHITFFCDSIPFHLDSLTTHPLGGTESSVLSLSKELSRLGHNITIVGKTPTYHTKDRVEFIPIGSFSIKYLKTDVFVSVRDPHAIASFDLSNCGKVIFWSHDVTQHPSMEHLLNNTAGCADKIDQLVIISDFVADQLRSTGTDLLSKCTIIRNGVDMDLVQPPEKDGDIINFTYHSMAYRGVVYLLEMWPTIHHLIPNSKLHLFTGDQIYGNADHHNQWIYNRARRLGVEVHEPVCQAELLKHLARMDVHLYPTDFVESSCTATMMSLASGCAVVTTDLGALAEQISGTNGNLVYGHPGANAYKTEFINKTEALVNERLRIAQNDALHMRTESWSKRAVEWLEMIERIDDGDDV